MRSSTLSRSVLAVAALGIGSAALVALPATAATPGEVTRETVLTVASKLRAEGDNTSVQTLAMLDAVAATACRLDAGKDETLQPGTSAWPTASGDDADGFVAYAVVFASNPAGVRFCWFGALAATAPTFELSGTATLTTVLTSIPGSVHTNTTITTPLSGDVVVSAPISAMPGSYFSDVYLDAAGQATHTTHVPGTKRVPDKKSTSQKKAAKKSYAKRLKAAKKKYAKALGKAGKSKAKRAAATKSYRAARSSARAKYRYAIASYKLVKIVIAQTEERPFSVSAKNPAT